MEVRYTSKKKVKIITPHLRECASCTAAAAHRTESLAKHPDTTTIIHACKPNSAYSLTELIRHPSNLASADISITTTASHRQGQFILSETVQCPALQAALVRRSQR